MTTPVEPSLPTGRSGLLALRLGRGFEVVRGVGRARGPGEVRMDRRGELRADAGELGDLLRGGLAQCRHRSEVAEERLDAGLAEPRHLGQHALDVAAPAPALV